MGTEHWRIACGWARLPRQVLAAFVLHSFNVLTPSATEQLQPRGIILGGGVPGCPPLVQQGTHCMSKSADPITPPGAPFTQALSGAAVCCAQC
jgi:hypothetical protein